MNFKDKFIGAVTKVSEHHYVTAIQRGFMATIGITIIGGILAVLKTPPFPANSTNAFATGWFAWSTANVSWLTVGYELTINFIAIYVLVGFVYALATHYKMNPLNPIAVSLGFFLINAVNMNLLDPTKPYMGFTMTTGLLGGQGIFGALVSGALVVELLRALGKAKSLKIKLPDAVPAMVSQPFESLFINIIIFGVALLIRAGLTSVGFMLPQVIMVMLYPVLKAAENIWVVVLLFALSRVLWFFGIHGTAIIFSVLTPILTINGVENLAAYAAGQPIPHVLTGGLILFQIGMLPAAIAMLIVARSAQLKAVAKLGFVPSLFMISEPILFGTPFVFNPILFIPHIAAFSFSIGLAYFSMMIGWVSKAIFPVPGFMPGFISSFLATGDWKAVVLYFVIVLGCVFIYLPFVKAYDKILVEKEKSNAFEG